MVKSPYETLGVAPSATDAQLRAAYRRLVQLHHPDHNNNSPESTRRFEEVQDAYAQIVRLRKTAPPPPRESAPGDPGVDTRLADLEREVRAAHAAREKVRRAARKASAATKPQDQRKRPSDEELGYVSTNDSFTKILADARTEIAGYFSEEHDHPVARRVSNLIDGLEELASKLDRDPGKRK